MWTKKRRISRSNLLINSSIGVSVLAVVFLAYSWSQNHFQNSRTELTTQSRLSIYGDEKPTLITKRMWLEKAYRDIQVEVLNGCGVDGVARRMTEYLRDTGFDVVNTENADHFDYSRTIVLDRSGDREKAVNVAVKLGLDTTAVRQEINEGLLLHATVIIGGDYESLPAFQLPASQKQEQHLR